MAIVLLVAGYPSAQGASSVVRLGTVIPAGTIWNNILKEQSAEWSKITSGRVRLVFYALMLGCLLGVVFGLAVQVATKKRGAFHFGGRPAAALGLIVGRGSAGLSAILRHAPNRAYREALAAAGAGGFGWSIHAHPRLYFV